MEQALLVCQTGPGAEKLKPLIKQAFAGEIAQVARAAEARSLAAERPFQLVVVNAPLPDESGLELVTELCRRSTAAVVFLVREEWLSMVFTPATEAGALVVSKPVNALLFSQAVRLGAAMCNRLKVLNLEYEKLQGRLEEQRAVARAKCLLIQNLHITEEEAHRAIEKQAMDMRLPKIRVAKELIRRFEL